MEKIMTIEFDDIKVNVTNPQVYAKVQRLILKLTGTRLKGEKNPYKSWTTEHIETLIDMHNAGATNEDIALKLGRTKSSVNIYLGRLQGKWGAPSTYTGSKRLKDQDAPAKREFVL